MILFNHFASIRCQLIEGLGVRDMKVVQLCLGCSMAKISMQKYMSVMGSCNISRADLHRDFLRLKAKRNPYFDCTFLLSCDVRNRVGRSTYFRDISYLKKSDCSVKEFHQSGGKH